MEGGTRCRRRNGGRKRSWDDGLGGEERAVGREIGRKRSGGGDGRDDDRRGSLVTEDKCQRVVGKSGRRVKRALSRLVTFFEAGSGVGE